MVGRALWQNLKTLVDCDKKILATHQNIQHINEQIDLAGKQVIALETALENKKRQLIIEKKNVASNELHATHLKNTEEQKRKALDLVKGSKDYKAVEKEIAVACTQRMEHEEILVRSWYTLEQLEKAIITEQQKVIAQNEILQREIASFREQISTLTHTLTTLNADRENAATLIPEEWLVRYNRMQASVPDPIVPVDQSSCSGCYYAVPRQDLIKLKTAGVLLCRSCYRFLYFNFDEAQDARKAKF
ncbi:MAG: hypothetical protein WCT20_00025 [Candidatus Babeliales bacterium]